ncbi:asparagine synthase (glutamine-hydrolyzing) [Cryomorphaceae bacterium]|nr:asparagine synthase (glutamine-hydrolyzing) [Cryomorphaceae bacterium]
MCGISGITTNDRGLIERMNRTMVHRGPDAEGYYVDEEIGLGHRRLSIIDLSEGGAQPRVQDHLVLTFNGELYNYLEIREELRGLGHRFDTESDTEVLLTAYKVWGADAFKKFIGMWALVIYDTKTHQMVMCRDRIGQKPLYYTQGSFGLAFASEIKALLQIPGIGKERAEALAEYLAFGFNPEPKTAYEDIFALEPGTYREWNRDQGLGPVRKYWSPGWDVQRPSEREALEELNELLQDSVKLRLRADVPLGVFLSGGLDSMGMTTLFKSPWTGLHVALNEDEHALVEKVMAEKEADLVVATPEEFDYRGDFDHVMKHFDTPFGDNSSIPTYWICREARKKGFIVMLGGDGGDELFYGYKRYKQLDLYSKGGGTVLMRGAHALSRRLLPGHDVDKALRFLAKPTFEDFYIKLRGGFTQDEWPNLLSKEYRKSINGYNPAEEVRKNWPTQDWPTVKQAQAFDWSQNFLSDILVKSDRMSMANSIELRSPFLDHRLFEWSAKLHPDVLYGGELKRLYKEWLLPRLPKEVLNQPKRGFGMNVNDLLHPVTDHRIHPNAAEWLKEQKKIFFLNSFNATTRHSS